jgi:hypothetical protein
MGTVRTSCEQQVSLSSTRYVVAGMLTAGDSAAETSTPDSDEDDDTSPPVEKLHKRRHGVVGRRCSTANAGRGDGEEALSGRRGIDTCKRALTPGSSVGSTMGELYSVPEYTEERRSPSF